MYSDKNTFAAVKLKNYRNVRISSGHFCSYIKIWSFLKRHDILLHVIFKRMINCQEGFIVIIRESSFTASFFFTQVLCYFLKNRQNRLDYLNIIFFFITSFFLLLHSFYPEFFIYRMGLFDEVKARNFSVYGQW